MVLKKYRNKHLLFSMNLIKQWFSTPLRKVGFEDIKYAIENPLKHVLINTMDPTEQECLIKNTIPIIREETLMNEFIDNYESKTIIIIVYGKNATDDSVETKYRQLLNLGFSEVYIYSGGMFEWLLLQDIYNVTEFPTTSIVRDLLKYRPMKLLNIPPRHY